MNKKIFIIVFIFISFIIFGNNIDIDFVNTDLKNALDDIAAMADIQIFYSESISGKIDLSINTTNVETALELLLFGKPYFFKKYSEKIYFVGDYREKTNMATYLLEPNIVKLSNISTNSISELLSLYPSRVKFLKDSNLIIIYGKDDVAMKILKMIRDIDNNSYTNKILAVNIVELSEIQWRVKETSNIINNYAVGKDIGVNFEFLNFEENLRYNYYNIFKYESSINFNFHDKKIDIHVLENDGFDVELDVDGSLVVDINLNYSQMNTPIYYFMQSSNKYFMIVLGVYEKRDYEKYFQENRGKYIGIEYEFNINTNYLGLEFLTNDYEINFKYGFFDKCKFTFTDKIVEDFYSKVGIDYFNDQLNVLLSFKEDQYFEEILLTGEIGLMSKVDFQNNSLTPLFEQFFYDIFIGYENDTIRSGAGLDLEIETTEIRINPYIESKISYTYDKFSFIGELSYIINNSFRVDCKGLYNF